ncbi:MAG: hypothetical protein WKF78_12755 [Candidatus Limnocylindrales bacterium]
MALTVRSEVLSLALRDPFRIARSDHGAGTRITTVLVELRDDRFPDIVGLGEGYPDRFYGETPDTMAAVIPLLLAAFGEPEADRRSALAAADAAMDRAIRGHGAAKCALDIALHDLFGKVVGLPVHEMLGLSADVPPTDFTLGLDEPAVVAERARRAADFPALKIKCGGPADVATLQRRPRGLRRPDPGRCQHGLDACGGPGTAPRPGRSRRRADRTAVPGPGIP